MKLCDDIKHLFWYQASHTANERKGHHDDIVSDIQKANEYFVSVITSSEITDDLASQIKAIGINIAWHWTNTLFGNADDAERDKASFEAAYNIIVGRTT